VSISPTGCNPLRLINYITVTETPNEAVFYSRGEHIFKSFNVGKITGCMKKPHQVFQMWLDIEDI
jgi:hypothetical protein